ncbi:unnamed protein product [Mytilus edulis]|uniref:Uncharacterized protein n=1 Tax=Mytilus edulis TaxID=6550 RepID=A0A8S3QSR3_MYTED|nr:unnamed protein product [Mytilus edulis]
MKYQICMINCVLVYEPSEVIMDQQHMLYPAGKLEKAQREEKEKKKLIRLKSVTNPLEKNTPVSTDIDSCDIDKNNKILSKEHSLIDSTESSQEIKQIDSLVKHIKRKHVTFYETHLSRWRQVFRDPQILQTLPEQNENIDDEYENANSDNENMQISNARRVHNADESVVDHVKKLAVFFNDIERKVWCYNVSAKLCNG